MPARRVKTIVLRSGERLPLLLDRDGVPMFGATLFVLTEVRGRNRSSNTIAGVLRSVMAFHWFLEDRGIDFDSRLTAGWLLSLGEVEDLVRVSRSPLNEAPPLAAVRGTAVPKVHSLERVRMSSQHGPRCEVQPQVAASRLRNIRAYINWLAGERCSKRALAQPALSRLADASRRTSEAITSRIPRQIGRGSLDQRQGLADSTIAELLRVVDPGCTDNPWHGEHARYRNALLIHWLLQLGLRIGEALGVRVSDIALREQQVTIHRRADDPEDPRAIQPQAKTRARVLRCGESLMLETQAYITGLRRAQRMATRHPFLFVADRTGRPMSLAAVAKMFRELRLKVPGLPIDLSAHLLRHTWNDAFSKRMETEHVDPVNEQRMRSYLMGWSPTSGTAASYTRRYVRRSANKASLDLQKQLLNMGRTDDKYGDR